MRDSNPDEAGRRNRRPDELSPLDKRIIEHLQQDGRRPFTQIAADLGVSEAAVRARTNRLVERGILQIVGVADPDALGFQQALIGIRCEPGKLLEVAEALASMPEVDYVVVTTGRFDVLIETVAEDNEGLLHFLADRLQRIDGVRDTETFSYLRLVKQTYQFGDTLMPTISEIVLASIGILATLAIALLIAPTFVWVRRRMAAQENQEVRTEGTLDPKAIARELANKAAGTNEDDVPPEAARAAAAQTATDPTLEDRIIRIVSWAFLMAVAVFAAASGLWNLSLPQIVILVAVTGEILLVLQDVLPRTPLRQARGPLQGALALIFAGALVSLTGGFESPFTFTFPLIVGAGALLVAPRIAFILAIMATAAYLGAGLSANQNPGTAPLVQMAVNLTGLYLLAYIGASIGREQRRARDAAIRMSTIDALTGLFNRTFFFTALEREIARGDRSGRAFCLVMLDLDDLKSVNDRFGHVAGDQVLRSVADIMKSGVRKIDVAARYGGDEFVALLPETDPTGGWVLAEKIRLTVAEQGMPGVDPVPTVSVGVVSYPADGRSADALLVSADRAMYASKRGGKNRVARATTEPMVLQIEQHEGRGARDAERTREGDRSREADRAG